MEYFKRYLSSPIVYFILIGILVLTNMGTLGYFLFFQDETDPVICEECPKVEEIAVVPEEVEKKETIRVDIKGYVKKPGVYEVESGTIVNDLVALAGGLKSGGTTENINLSKRLYNEDMIVVLSKAELKKSLSAATNSNGQSNSSTSSSGNSSIVSNTKVSLNKASKEELMTLNGIGEAKALAIIEYRKEKPFTEIAELMQVSGIGESIYEKIKDFIIL